MATDRPQGDHVGWRMDNLNFRIGKTIEISSMDKKAYPTHAVVVI